MNCKRKRYHSFFTIEKITKSIIKRCLLSKSLNFISSFLAKSGDPEVKPSLVLQFNNENTGSFLMLQFLK